MARPETSPVTTMSDAGDSIEIRVNTVGRAMPQIELQIVSPVTGEVVPTGEQGEICIRGYTLMKGYDGAPKRPRRSFTRMAGSTPATSASCARTAAFT